MNLSHGSSNIPSGQVFAFGRVLVSPPIYHVWVQDELDQLTIKHAGLGITALNRRPGLVTIVSPKRVSPYYTTGFATKNSSESMSAF